jgi:hypothetical protein
LDRSLNRVVDSDGGLHRHVDACSVHSDGDAWHDVAVRLGEGGVGTPLEEVSAERLKERLGDALNALPAVLSIRRPEAPKARLI